MLHIKEPGFEPFSGGLLLPFTPWTWRVIIAAILVIIIILSTTWRLGGRYRDRDKDEQYNLYNSVLYVAGIFCQQSKYLFLNNYS
jgi:membrane protein implicated in regulation of membrane protease activity